MKTWWYLPCKANELFSITKMSPQIYFKLHLGVEFEKMDTLTSRFKIVPTFIRRSYFDGGRYKTRTLVYKGSLCCLLVCLSAECMSFIRLSKAFVSEKSRNYDEILGINAKWVNLNHNLLVCSSRIIPSFMHSITILQYTHKRYYLQINFLTLH